MENVCYGQRIRKRKQGLTWKQNVSGITVTQFLMKVFLSPWVQLLRVPTDLSVSSARTEKTTGIWKSSQRHWTSKFHTSCVYNFRRYGPRSNCVFKRLACVAAEKKGVNYAETMGFMRCAVKFCLLRAVLSCIRSSHSSARVKVKKQFVSEAAAVRRFIV